CPDGYVSERGPDRGVSLTAYGSPYCSCVQAPLACVSTGAFFVVTTTFEQKGVNTSARRASMTGFGFPRFGWSDPMVNRSVSLPFARHSISPARQISISSREHRRRSHPEASSWTTE